VASAASRRQPILEATIRVIGRKGYQATAVADVIAEAQASRSTFYKYFDDKRDAFLAAYELALERILAAARAGCARGGPWPDSARCGLAAIVDLFCREPALARTAVVEFAAAGEEARRRHGAALGRLARLLDEGRRPRQPRLPPSTALMTAGGVAALIAEERPASPRACPSSSSPCWCPSSARARPRESGATPPRKAPRLRTCSRRRARSGPARGSGGRARPSAAGWRCGRRRRARRRRTRSATAPP
jgi:AcrR family transcriptional regulator